MPNTEQKNLAFGAAASMVHPATGMKLILHFCTFVEYYGFLVQNLFAFMNAGYSVVRSLSEAPNYASAIANILKQNLAKDMITRSISAQGTLS